MSGSGPSILIAINGRGEHVAQSVLACCTSVKLACDRLGVDIPASKPRCCLYVEDIDALDPMLRSQVSGLGIAISSCPGTSNGERLNRQLEDAIRSGDDLFFRVDGDDTVAEQRFSWQVGLFMTSDADIIGAGLTYRPVGSGREYLVIPNASPRALDYVFNRFMLHPTMGIRVEAVTKTGLRYWTRRLEDKELILRATALGLVLRNDPVIYGDYFVNPAARNSPDMANLARDLTLDYLRQTKHRALVPLAYFVWVTRLLLPTPFLRRLRSVLFPARTKP